MDEAVAKKAKLVEIIPGKGSGQLKKRVLRFLDRKDDQAALPPCGEGLAQLRPRLRALPAEVGEVGWPGQWRVRLSGPCLLPFGRIYSLPKPPHIQKDSPLSFCI